MTIIYDAPMYRMSDAALAADVPLNTMRSYYARDEFRIIDGVKKEGRGVASLMTLRDVICASVASRLIEAGMRVNAAFLSAMEYAYFGDSSRAPSKPIADYERTILIWRAEDDGGQKIVGVNETVHVSDLLSDREFGLSGGPTIIVDLSQVQRRVFWALNLIDLSDESVRAWFEIDESATAAEVEQIMDEISRSYSEKAHTKAQQARWSRKEQSR